MNKGVKLKPTITLDVVVGQEHLAFDSPHDVVGKAANLFDGECYARCRFEFTAHSNAVVHHRHIGLLVVVISGQ